jgi:hypothetical protein
MNTDQSITKAGEQRGKGAEANSPRPMTAQARTARIWSAVTCHRFVRLADLSARQGRVQRPGAIPRARQFDGDKSPAKSGENSPHSKVR